MPLTLRTAVRMAVDIGDKFLVGKTDHYSFTVVPTGRAHELRLRLEFDDDVVFDALERGLIYAFPEADNRSETQMFNAQVHSVFASTLATLRGRVADQRCKKVS